MTVYYIIFTFITTIITILSYMFITFNKRFIDIDNTIQAILKQIKQLHLLNRMDIEELNIYHRLNFNNKENIVDKDENDVEYEIVNKDTANIIAKYSNVDDKHTIVNYKSHSSSSNDSIKTSVSLPDYSSTPIKRRKLLSVAL